ncbi:MAG TPA: phosphoribosyltransferase family protein [Flavobacteriaceae bacterium]|nr:phosphoribosyltransferase family protein [Flavobacteriaceae bacterium]
MIFNNRTEAANLLIQQLTAYNNAKNAVIAAIPRGGLPIGYILAKELGLPLEVVLTKKIGHPLHKEFAIGAVTLTDRILSEDANDISMEYIEAETKRIRDILKQRQDFYYGKRRPMGFKGKMVIIVDDGVATGQTLKSSIQFIGKQHPSQIIVALPVGPPSTIDKISNMPYVEKTICLITPQNFRAVGQYYMEFNQVSDDEAIRYFTEANKQVKADI